MVLNRASHAKLYSANYYISVMQRLHNNRLFLFTFSVNYSTSTLILFLVVGDVLFVV